jgi:hypothetical protein
MNRLIEINSLFEIDHLAKGSITTGGFHDPRQNGAAAP